MRLTDGGQVSTAPLVLALDKRATFTVADRKAQYDAAERIKALFARMSTLNAELQTVKAQATEAADKPGANAAQAKAVAAKADMLRKLLVATKEGGAITGEERLREHMDQAYAAVTATEQRPTPYAMAYIDALERELAEVEGQYAALAAGDVAKLSAALEAHGLEGIDLADYELDEDDARGGPVSALAAGLVGLHFTGKATDLMETGEKD